ncbi:hypothetical protein UACE39S_05221 [Ureibacillus acetophenoni]
MHTFIIYSKNVGTVENNKNNPVITIRTTFQSLLVSFFKTFLTYKIKFKQKMAKQIMLDIPVIKVTVSIKVSIFYESPFKA